MPDGQSRGIKVWGFLCCSCLSLGFPESQNWLEYRVLVSIDLVRTSSLDLALTSWKSWKMEAAGKAFRSALAK